MLAMDQIHHIRALYYEQGYNISEIAKATVYISDNKTSSYARIDHPSRENRSPSTEE